MTQLDPDNRPTATEALNLFTRIERQAGGVTTLRRLRPKGETAVPRVFRNIYSAFTIIIYPLRILTSECLNTIMQYNLRPSSIGKHGFSAVFFPLTFVSLLFFDGPRRAMRRVGMLFGGPIRF